MTRTPVPIDFYCSNVDHIAMLYEEVTGRIKGLAGDCEDILRAAVDLQPSNTGSPESPAYHVGVVVNVADELITTSGLHADAWQALVTALDAAERQIRIQRSLKNQPLSEEGSAHAAAGTIH